MKTIRQVLVLLCTFASASFAFADDEHTKDSLDTVKKNIKDKKALLVDVREKEEWDLGHVSGAVLLPLSEVRKGIKPADLEKKLPKDKIIYTHCAVGIRSVDAGEILKEKGYDVRPLGPGYQDLIKAGFEKAKK